MRKTKTLQIALCGLFAALAVTIMTLGGVIPVATFCCPMLAALLLVPVRTECGDRLGLAWYAAVSVLSVLLAPDKEAAAVFLALGWYPIVRPRLEKLPGLARVALKLVLFNGTVAALYTALLFVIKVGSIREDFFGTGTALLLVLAVLGNVTFCLFDQLLPRMELLYRLRLRPRLWRGH